MLFISCGLTNKLLFRWACHLIELEDSTDISEVQKEYIETKSGAGMASSSRTVCEHCDNGRHNKCIDTSNCYCAQNSHRML
jgi:hypothetical protein